MCMISDAKAPLRQLCHSVSVGLSATIRCVFVLVILYLQKKAKTEWHGEKEMQLG